MSLSIDNKHFSSVHFVGVFGAGMSALAQYCIWQGCRVSGSDRLLDAPDTLPVKRSLQSLGCAVVAQDGSGMRLRPDAVVVSTAIEETNPDIAAAKAAGIPLYHRSDVLAAIVAGKRTIAIAGTSGKSTVAALCFDLLAACGFSPSLITGAALRSLENKGLIGNAYYGDSDLLVVEADESDGTLVKYHPALSVFLNISKDHKPVGETVQLFRTLALQSGAVIVNGDDPLLQTQLPSVKTFGLSLQTDFHPDKVDFFSPSIRFTIKKTVYESSLVGRHNLENVVAALCACSLFNCQESFLCSAVSAFQGIARRFSVTPTKNGTLVIDDYAHNPEKIKAVLRAAQSMAPRVFAIFQPHGYGPLRFFKDELIDVFANVTRAQDRVFILPVYYAGGTAVKDISSSDVVDALRRKKITAFAPVGRSQCIDAITTQAQPGDAVLSMGARDPSLAAFAREIVLALEKGE